jgi:hypothetical protein
MLYGSLFGAGLALALLIARVIVSEGGISQMNKVFRALREGGVDAARSQLDGYFKPTARVGARAPRFAALALIGDGATLAREVAAVTEPVKASCLAKAYGLLGLIVLGDPSASAQLAAHAAECERDLPRTFGKIRQAVRGIAAIGAAVPAGSTDPLTELRPGLFVFGTPWTKALLWDACARAFERDGQPQRAANTRAINAHLERARAAA